ncbi:MAG: hypothetical protein GY870_20975 [archaeon]|nr:hypothetical protein [archaeon]
MSEKGKPRLHTTISVETEKLIEKYAKLKDRNSEEIYGNKSKVIEKAIELLDKHHNPEKEEIQNIWNRSRNEVNMALIGKSTFLSLIKGENTVNENLAVDIIEWYKGQQIDEIPLEMLLKAIKEIWVATNYFINIKIEETNRKKETFRMSFFHNFQSEMYSKYWGDYFRMFLLKRNKCDVAQYSANKSSFILIINEFFEQEKGIPIQKQEGEKLLYKKGFTPFFDKNGTFVGYLQHEPDESKT